MKQKTTTKNPIDVIYRFTHQQKAIRPGVFLPVEHNNCQFTFLRLVFTHEALDGHRGHFR